MRRWLTFFVFLACTAVEITAALLQQLVNFNREWMFQLGDYPGAEAANFDDSRWERVGLPRSFSMPYFAAGNVFYVGYGADRRISLSSTNRYG